MTVPFPGESIRVYEAFADDGYGWELGDAVSLRAGAFNNSDTHRTIAAGTDWYCFAYRLAAPSYLEPGDTTPLAVSWVVEVLSGSGVLDVWDLDDVDYDTPLTAGSYPNHLGTITVTGPGTYTIATSSMSRASLESTPGSLAARISCTSGSVDVQQVKVRVWPVGGPLGGWSTGTYDADPGSTLAPSVAYTTNGTDDAEDPATLQATVATLPIVTYPTPGGGLIIANGGSYTGNPPVNSYAGAYGATYLTRPYEGLRYIGPGAQGEVWIRPPEEVERDANDVLFDPSGEDSVEWVQGQVTGRISSNVANVDGMIYAGTVRVAVDELDTRDPDGTLYSTIAPGSIAHSYTPGGTVGYDVTFSLPEFAKGKTLRLLLSNSGLYGDEGLGGSGISIRKGRYTLPDASDLEQLSYHWQPSPYRYWTPEPAVVDTLPKVRQIHRDERGMTPPRQFGGASRATTGRHFGYD